MRITGLVIVAAAASSVVAQSTVCTAEGLLSCVAAPLSTTCADYACACSQVAYQTDCYSSFCSGIPIPSDVLTAYNNVCSPGSGGSGGGSDATTTADAAGATAATGGTATGSQPGATSKAAAANMGSVVPSGGLVAAMLGVMAFL